MKKALAFLLLMMLFLSSCTSGEQPQNSASPSPSPTETPSPNPDDDNPNSSNEFIDDNNPIDWSIDFSNAISTYEQTAVSNYYMTSWKYEMQNAAYLLGKTDELYVLEKQAKTAAEVEGEKWGSGTGRTSAELMAEADVYKRATYRFINELTSRQIGYEYLFTTDYQPLLNALLYSQVQEYDSFNEEPSAYTANTVIYQMVYLYQLFPGKETVSPNTLDYVFSQNIVGDNVIEISPDDLYRNYFEYGSYKNPPTNLPAPITALEDGIAMTSSDFPISPLFIITQAELQGNFLVVDLNLSRIDHGSGMQENIGSAKVTFKKSDSSVCGYKIVSYKPDYGKF